MTAAGLGVFIVIEGPNGAGKTTTVALLGKELRQRGHAVHLTAEPSDSALGRLIRSGEQQLTGRALALAVAADRYAHVEGEIAPALALGRLVISDRYVPSSLVLQRIDGLAHDEIWVYNAHVPAPTTTIYLHASPQELQDRLNRRRHHSRLEQLGSPARELAYYQDAHDYLAGRGWRQHQLPCDDLDPSQVTGRIIEHLEPILGS